MCFYIFIQNSAFKEKIHGLKTATIIQTSSPFLTTCIMIMMYNAYYYRLTAYDFVQGCVHLDLLLITNLKLSEIHVIHNAQTSNTITA